MEKKRGGRPGAGGGREVTISKCLSWILRHGAVELGLSIRPDGYVPLSEVLEVPNVKSKQDKYNLCIELKATIEEI